MDLSQTLKEKTNWKYFFRQLLVCSGAWSCYFMLGLNYGAPTVLVPQLRAANITLADELASWLPVTLSYSGIPWIFILSILTTIIGRKKTHFIVGCSCLIGYTIMLSTTSMNLLIISQIFQGSSAAAYLTTAIVIITEYASSENRGLFLTVKSATFFWGILTANAIGTFFHYSNIAILGALCAVFNIITVFMWPESPYWLLDKGKLNECSESHIWLNGNGTKSLKVLEILLKSHESKRFTKQNTNIRRMFKIVFQRSSLKAIMLISLLICLYNFSGKMICSVYAVDILKRITKDNWTAYVAMLILDGVTVSSMYIGCFIAKILRSRVMLIGFSSLGITFVMLLSLYLFLVKIKVVTEHIYVSIALLAGYSISISCGPMIMSTSIIGELIPLESRGLFMCIIAFIFKFIFGTFLIISPYCFKYLQMHGTFLLYGILSTVFLILIYFYMPETKNKTLQEIDNNLKGKANQQEAREQMLVL